MLNLKSKLNSMLCLKSKLNPMLCLKKKTKLNAMELELEHEQLVKGVNKCKLEKNTVS